MGRFPIISYCKLLKSLFFYLQITNQIFPRYLSWGVFRTLPNIYDANLCDFWRNFDTFNGRFSDIDYFWKKFSDNWQNPKYATVIDFCIWKKHKVYRSSHRRCSIKKSVFKNLAKLTGKHLWQSVFFNKVARLT